MWQVAESKIASLKEVKEEWYYSDLLKFAYRSNINYINQKIAEEKIDGDS